MKWKDHVPAKNALLSAINDESGKIKEAKSRIVDKFAGKEPHEIFEQYVNAELKAMIVEETNRYAAQKNSKTLFTTADLETFNAVLMLTGYHSLPRTRMFWEKEDDIGLSIVYESFSQREFKELKRFIHFADNDSLSTNDKFAKVRQLYGITNKNLKQFGFFRSHYSIDEQMVPCTGKNSRKQTIRTKTIRFGYKNFIICSDDGYPHFIDPYCGAKYGDGKASKNLTARSVIDCILEIDNWDDRDVYFDNWFTSLSLIAILKEHGVRATGTVRADRLGKDLKINKKDIKCKERGAMQVYCERSGISRVTWNGNGPVAILSNVHADLPYTQVKRWDSSQRNYIKINRYNCIIKYNKHMGGVDSLDAHVSVYRTDVREKKWYWPHYINTIDVLKSAAFKVFKLVNPDDKMDFLAFTLRITTHYLKAFKLKKQLPPNIIYPRKRSWKGNAVVPANERKQDQHFVEKYSQKLCRVCPSRPRTWCPICKIGLCIEPCFKAFHMD